MPTPRRPALEDLVAEEQVVDLVAELAELAHHLTRLVDPARRQIVLEAADAVEVGMEPAAGRALDQVEHVLAIAEGEEHRRDRPELHAEVAEEQPDVGDPAELEQDRADVLGPRRCFDAHQLFGGEDERHLVGEAAQPVDAVDQGGDLREGANLGELLVAAMHVAGHRLGPHHLLAVEAGDDAQRAVRGRVLRADVEGHALRLELDVEARVGRLSSDVRQLLTLIGDRSLEHTPRMRGSERQRVTGEQSERAQRASGSGLRGRGTQ